MLQMAEKEIVLKEKKIAGLEEYIKLFESNCVCNKNDMTELKKIKDKIESE